MNQKFNYHKSVSFEPLALVSSVNVMLSSQETDDKTMVTISASFCTKSSCDIKHTNSLYKCMYAMKNE